MRSALGYPPSGVLGSTERCALKAIYKLPEKNLVRPQDCAPGTLITPVNLVGLSGVWLVAMTPSLSLGKVPINLSSNAREYTTNNDCAWQILPTGFKIELIQE